jgi:hypothetical protein
MKSLIKDGYEWSTWLNSDTAEGDGDWETRSSFTQSQVCASPIAVQANPLNLNSSSMTHIDNDLGFWCINEEQPYGTTCADFEVRFCCPKLQVGECNVKGEVI